MEKFNYGNFNPSESLEGPFTEAKGYVNPGTEEMTRKELSYPLNEVKRYINENLFDEDDESKIDKLQESVDDLQNAIDSLDEEKADKEDTYTKTEVDNALGNKVDKVAGKGLSTNDYDNTEKEKVASALQPSALTPYRTSANQDIIDNGKVDKEANKSLVSNTDIAQISTNKSDIATIKGMLPPGTSSSNRLVNNDFFWDNANIKFFALTSVGGLFSPAGKQIYDYVRDNVLTDSFSVIVLVGQRTSQTKEVYAFKSFLSNVCRLTQIDGYYRQGSILSKRDIIIYSDGSSEYQNNTSSQIEFLQKNNTSPYTPTGNYNPATKQYVDQTAGSPHWNNVQSKPFNTLGSSMKVESGVLDADLSPYRPSSEQDDIDEAKEDVSNKENTISTSTSKYPSSYAVNNAIEDVREVAEGKTKTYVCSDATNPILNSQDASITLTSNLTDIKGNVIALSSLKVGDNIYVVETDVPDRWVSISGTTITLHKLETAKVPVNDVQVDGTSVVNNGIANINLEDKVDVANITHETWTFTLSDNTTVDKEVVLWISQV